MSKVHLKNNNGNITFYKKGSALFSMTQKRLIEMLAIERWYKENGYDKKNIEGLHIELDKARETIRKYENANR